jgi:hypothetical protein
MRASLGEQLGDEVAEDLMDSLPPFDWTQIATKDDIRYLDAKFEVFDERFKLIDKRFDLVDQRFELLETKLGTKMLRLSIGSTITSVGVLAGLMALLN